MFCAMNLTSLFQIILGRQLWRPEWHIFLKSGKHMRRFLIRSLAVHIYVWPRKCKVSGHPLLKEEKWHTWIEPSPEGQYTKMVSGPRESLRDLRLKRADLDLVELSYYAFVIPRSKKGGLQAETEAETDIFFLIFWCQWSTHILVRPQAMTNKERGLEVSLLPKKATVPNWS